MPSPIHAHEFWKNMLDRIAGGESQSALAAASGLSIGQFRYRLRKHLESMSALAETAAAREEGRAYDEQAAAVETPEREPCQPQSEAQDSLPRLEVDPSLFDESWHRPVQSNALVLMVKEPRTLFAYWSVSDVRKDLVREHFQSPWEELPFYLQVYDVTDVHFDGTNAHDSQRIAVRHDHESWYLHDLQPGRRYLVDFGTTTWHGHFFTLLRSNIVQTPPDKQELRTEPSVRFGQVVPSGQRAKCEQIEGGELLPVADREWGGLFDGYTLSERKGGGF